MNRFSIVAALTIGLIGPVPLPAVGPDKAPRPLPLPREVVAAWEKAGAIFKEGDVPTFRFLEWKAGVLAKLPRPDRGFGLDLYETQVTDAGLKELAAFKKLQTLNLGSTKVTDAGLKELAALKELRTLNLGSTKVTNMGLRELVELKELRSLNLGDTQVTDAGLRELARINGLQTLNLSYTKVTNVGFKELAGLKELRTLNLSKTKVRDAGLKELGKLKQLEQLDLYSAEVTYAGLKELAGLERLHTLNLDGHEWTMPLESTGAKLKELVGATKRSITAAQCERLVAQVVNPDKPPALGDNPSLPKGIDGRKLFKKQEKIREAYDTLSDNIEISLPILGKYVGDTRFSYIFQQPNSGVYLEESVGGACSSILSAHVEVYRPHVTKFYEPPRTHSLYFISECGGFEKWWQGRKDKTLAELQLEGIEWALRHEKPEYFKSAEEWAAAKKSLREMAEAIRTSKSPIVVVHRLGPFFSGPVPE